jgi:hypothetical protein
LDAGFVIAGKRRLRRGASGILCIVWRAEPDAEMVDLDRRSWRSTSPTQCDAAVSRDFETELLRHRRIKPKAARPEASRAAVPGSGTVKPVSVKLALNGPSLLISVPIRDQSGARAPGPSSRVPDCRCVTPRGNGFRRVDRRILNRSRTPQFPLTSSARRGQIAATTPPPQCAHSSERRPEQ